MRIIALIDDPGVVRPSWSTSDAGRPRPPAEIRLRRHPTGRQLRSASSRTTQSPKSRSEARGARPASFAPRAMRRLHGAHDSSRFDVTGVADPLLTGAKYGRTHRPHAQSPPESSVLGERRLKGGIDLPISFSSFVGAGGLGQMLYVALSVFKMHKTARLLLALIAIVSVVDLLSAWLRPFLGRSGA